MASSPSPMGSSLPPLPGQSTPPNAASGISGLLGNVQGVTLPATGPTPQQMTQAYMDQVRRLHIDIDTLAQDHPEAAEDLNNAKNALTNSMSKVATAMSAPSQGVSPPTF